MDYDVIIVGLGGMGAASADALAGRGLRVLAVDQFDLGHARGASHGRSRIVRQAYFESPDYIPLLRRAYALWDTFPADCRLRRVGCLMLGPDDSRLVAGATRSAEVWQIPIELLTAAEVTDRFPQFAPGPGDVALFEPDAGFVRPEETVAFLAARARTRGAELMTERVHSWEVTGHGVRVWTPMARSPPSGWCWRLGPGHRPWPRRWRCPSASSDGSSTSSLQPGMRLGSGPT